MKAPFRLVRGDHEGGLDVAPCIRELLRDAEHGDCIGVAWVSMYKSREWDYKTCGEAFRNPAWSLAMLQAFVVKLANEINHR